MENKIPNQWHLNPYHKNEGTGPRRSGRKISVMGTSEYKSQRKGVWGWVVRGYRLEVGRWGVRLLSSRKKKSSREGWKSQRKQPGNARTQRPWRSGHFAVTLRRPPEGWFHLVKASSFSTPIYSSDSFQNSSPWLCPGYSSSSLSKIF